MLKQFVVVIAVLLFAVAGAYGNTVGVTYSEVLGDRSAGLSGDYTIQLTERITFESDAIAQAGDAYNIDVNTDFVIDTGVIDLSVLINNKAQGYSLDGLGRQQTVGLGFIIPVETSTDITVGIGGRNSNPFASPNAYDTLVDEGFNGADLDGKGLDAITPNSVGLPFKVGSSANAFIATGFGIGIFDVDARAIVELIGDGEKQHQAILNFKTGGKVGGIDITTSIELSLMTWDSVVYRELATVTTAGINF